MYFNGSKHKDGAEIGILVISPTGILTRFSFEIENNRSNNEVEYAALNAGLELLLSLNDKIIVVRGDSQLVIRQLTGQYNCVNVNMIYCFSSAIVVIKKFDEITFKHVPRIENEIANELAQRESSYKVLIANLEALCKVKERFPLNQIDIFNLNMGNKDDWKS